MGNRTRPGGPVRRLAWLGVLAAGALGVPGLGAGVAAAHGRAARALYYETRTAAGRLAIDRLGLVAPHARTQVIALPDVGVFGMAVAQGHLLWVTESAPADRGSIMQSTLSGGRVRRLVGGLPAPNSIAVAAGFVYWSDEDAVGRVALDGSRLQRRFVVLPRERGGGVADGLASDGTHLYFSRCLDDAIGRLALAGGRITRRFIATGPRSCPQGLAVAGGHVYWTQLGSGTIGRARLNGSGTSGRWLNIRSDQGPFQLAADTAHVYWTWGGVDGSPAYTGRAGVSGSPVVRRFLTDSVYPLALAGGP